MNRKIDREELREMFEQEKVVTKLADYFGVSSRTIQRHLDHIAPDRSKTSGHWTAEMNTRVDALLADGLPASWIREDVPGTTLQGIRNRRIAGGFPKDGSLSHIVSGINLRPSLRPLHESIAPR